MKPIGSTLLLACLTLVAGACASGLGSYDYAVRDAKSPDCEIEVFDSAFVNRPHIRLGEIRLPTHERERAKIVRRLKEEACGLGADAIMAVSMKYSPRSGNAGMEPAGAAGFGEYIWSAVAIGWMTPPATAEEAPPS